MSVSDWIFIAFFDGCGALQFVTDDGIFHMELRDTSLFIMLHHPTFLRFPVIIDRSYSQGAFNDLWLNTVAAYSLMCRLSCSRLYYMTQGSLRLEEMYPSSSDGNAVRLNLHPLPWIYIGEIQELVVHIPARIIEDHRRIVELRETRTSVDLLRNNMDECRDLQHPAMRFEKRRLACSLLIVEPMRRCSEI